MGQPESKPARFPQPGDHIYCDRKGGLYDHHGIYVGDDMVIHLQRAAKKLGPLPPCHKCADKRDENGEIAKVCIDCFLDGETLQIYEYGVPFLELSFRKRSTCSPYNSGPPHEVIIAATVLLEQNGFGPYNMFSNNSKHFAVYCKIFALSLIDIIKSKSKPIPQPGDHIYCKREGGLYDHHGIYVGDDMVIHLQGKAKKLQGKAKKPLPECHKCADKRDGNGEIVKICIDCFLRGEKPQIYEYGVPFPEFRFRKRGTCSPHNSKPPHEVIRTATAFLGGIRFPDYNMVNNNCEDFAVYCKTGINDGYQIFGYLEKANVVSAVAAVSAIGGPPGIALGAASMAAYGISKAFTGAKSHN